MDNPMKDRTIFDLQPNELVELAKIAGFKDMCIGEYDVVVIEQRLALCKNAHKVGGGNDYYFFVIDIEYGLQFYGLPVEYDLSDTKWKVTGQRFPLTHMAKAVDYLREIGINKFF